MFTPTLRGYGGEEKKEKFAEKTIRNGNVEGRKKRGKRKRSAQAWM